jgi:transcription antitermination protein NusB
MNDNLQCPEAEYNDELMVEDLSPSDQRSVIFHLLYALDIFDYQVSLESIADNFAKGYNIIIPTTSKAFIEASAIAQEREPLDSLMVPLLANWRFDRLGVCTRIILRLGAWEILHTNIDASIVINEAIELSKGFAEKDSYKFVNGILDELAKRYKIPAASA